MCHFTTFIAVASVYRELPRPGDLLGLRFCADPYFPIYHDRPVLLAVSRISISDVGGFAYPNLRDLYSIGAPGFSYGQDGGNEETKLKHTRRRRDDSNTQ